MPFKEYRVAFLKHNKKHKKIRKHTHTHKLFLNVCCVLVFYVLLCCYVCLCTGHFVTVPLNSTCLHSLQFILSLNIPSIHIVKMVVYKRILHVFLGNINNIQHFKCINALPNCVTCNSNHPPSGLV